MKKTGEGLAPKEWAGSTLAEILAGCVHTVSWYAKLGCDMVVGYITLLHFLGSHLARALQYSRNVRLVVSYLHFLGSHLARALQYSRNVRLVVSYCKRVNMRTISYIIVCHSTFTYIPLPVLRPLHTLG